MPDDTYIPDDRLRDYCAQQDQRCIALESALKEMLYHADKACGACDRYLHRAAKLVLSGAANDWGKAQRIASNEQ